MRKRRSDLPDKADHAAARDTAVGFLARREHAKSEVQHKLRHHGFDEEIAAGVVDELSRQRLLSDERFAEVFIRSRAERGQGPVRLRAELRQLQVPSDLVERYLQAADVDWTTLARQVRRRKFGDRIANLPAERAKQMRFLQYRGFSADQIRAALGGRSAADDDLLDVASDDLAD